MLHIICCNPSALYPSLQRASSCATYEFNGREESLDFMRAGDCNKRLYSDESEAFVLILIFCSYLFYSCFFQFRASGC